MTPSIRTFLLINLLLSITLITSLAIIGNLFLEHKDFQKHLNAQLTFAALTMQAFLDEDFDETEIATIQKKINRLPKVAQKYYHKEAEEIINPSYELIQFQVWNNHGDLVLRSPSAPKKPLSRVKEGFSTNWVDHQLWHVFTDIDELTNFRIDVAERSDFREELEGRVTQDSIFIMLITYPFLGILIWIIVGRGLDSIRQVTDELRLRKPSNLEPVSLEVVPTEIQPLVDELNELFTRLHEAFEREKRFASDAAHELKTPLAALKTQTQVAMMIKDPEELKAALEKIIAGADRSTHVVHQLLTMSRMAPQATIQQEETVEIVSLAREVISEVVISAIEKDIEVELDAPNDNIQFTGYPTAVGIMIRNLVDNAIRYCPSGSLVKVGISQTTKHVVLTVADNGPGIPEDLRERVFERFFRVLGTKTSGSGLGLGIVQQIAQIHHANIELSEPKVGTGLVISVRFNR